MRTHEQVIEKLMSRPGVRAEVARLERARDRQALVVGSHPAQIGGLDIYANGGYTSSLEFIETQIFITDKETAILRELVKGL